jgi:hypothetical protein
MQINEITRRRLNEVGFAAGLATGLQGALSKVGVQGPALEPGKYTGPTMNRAQALAQAQKQVQTLIPVMQKNWAKAVQDALAQSTDPATSAPATGVDKMTTGDQNSLKAQLVSLVNSAVYPQYPQPPQYKNLPTQVGEDPTTKAQAMQVVQDIDSAVDTIFQGTMSKSTNVQQAWQTLGRDGIAPAQAIAIRDAGGGTVITMSQGVRRLTNLLKLDDGDIVKIRQVIQTPGGDQFATAILDKTTPATTASPLIKRFGQQTKLTDTELASLIALAQDAANDAAFKEMFGLRA